MTTEQMTSTRPGVAGLVEQAQRALYLLDETQRAVPVATTVADRAARAEQLAELYRQRRDWWERLAAWVYSPAGDVPLIFGKAAYEAAEAARSDVRFWTETAQFWRDRAAGRAADDGTGRGCG